MGVCNSAPCNSVEDLFENEIEEEEDEAAIAPAAGLRTSVGPHEGHKIRDVLRATPVSALVLRYTQEAETRWCEDAVVAFEAMLSSNPPSVATPVWNEATESYVGWLDAHDLIPYAVELYKAKPHEDNISLRESIEMAADELLTHFGQDTTPEAPSAEQTPKPAALSRWKKAGSAVQQAVHKRIVAGHVARAFQGGLSLEGNEHRTASGFAKLRPLKGCDVEEDLLSVAEQLAAGHRRVCALSEGRVVWTISQERFVSFFHVEHTLHELHTEEPALTGTLKDWGFRADPEALAPYICQGTAPLVDCLEKA